MTTPCCRRLPIVAVSALLVACRGDAPTALGKAAAAPSFNAFAGSEWSAPVNLGTVINTAANEQAPMLSPDGLSLYFLSNRTGGMGGNDIWVARRDCEACEWQAPRNLGGVINTSFNEGGPSLSSDGHLLFFVSGLPDPAGLAGGGDIFVSRRIHVHDDLAWEAPVRLGGGVNTAENEAGPDYVPNAEEGRASLYFNRGALPAFAADIWVAAVTRAGEVLGPAVLVDELSEPASNDATPSVRGDGREIFFWSFGREGAVGGGDLYTSTRRSVHEPWSDPVRMPAPFSTEAGDIGVSLSSDARTLLIVSNRLPGQGGFDIYVSTRTPSGR